MSTGKKLITLANMMDEDESALICDLAETYHIFDYRSLSPLAVATLSIGLREDSRIKMKLRKQTASDNTILLAIIADRLGQLLYTDPPVLYENFIIKEETEQACGFDTAEEYEQARQKILRGN